MNYILSYNYTYKLQLQKNVFSPFNPKEGFKPYTGILQRYVNYATSRPEIIHRLFLIQYSEKNKLSVLENCAVLALS